MMPIPPINATPSSDTYLFDSAALRRLGVYRAAIRAGFYTDQMRPGESEHITTWPTIVIPAVT